MKKLISLILSIVCLLIPVLCIAEIDLSGMNYDELIALKEQINLAIWNSQEWEEVEVPQGVWIVGKDIPAGHWTIKCPDGWRKTEINWGENIDEAGETISWSGRHSVYNGIYNEKHKYYEEGDGETSYSFEARDGEYIVIDDAPAIFMPYSGKPSLGFKAFSK